MPVHFATLHLFDSAQGSLAEIELAHPDMPPGERRWLWIEPNWVTLLHPVNEGTPTLRVFDGAVLALDGQRGELRWHDGRRNALLEVADASLRPEFRRLVHQHLN
ncbi:hypothetical protein [Diaphorobacter nitroreducens]|jgi:hypothetical protein|uniref:hypothetical protein n=1 Tax=Diaphorobacter nitroreducens TaxID=164759 RepID=UPI0005DAF3B4|nr:hypothetical protein [Diaphorobacter nitroreducens]GAO20218.1 pyrrolo-quinoline quinone [Alicycliphilus sp. B1]HVR51624.1 hypothetical protein [Pseudorhodoferax sp.]